MTRLEAEFQTASDSVIEADVVAAPITFSEARPDSKVTFYKPELDVLRFFAFLMVFVTHFMLKWNEESLVALNVPRWVAKISLAFAHGGAYGVDLFFVLSAYLITELLLRERATIGSLNVPAFYLRRILRIWPLYYMFVAMAAFIPFLNPHHEFNFRYIIPFIGLAGNWSFIWFGWPNSIAVPLWSVSVEEQFYLLWPPIVARMSQRQIVIIAICLIVVANITRLIAVGLHADTLQLWGNTLVHLDSIAAGVLLAVQLGGKVLDLKYRERVALLLFGIFCLTARGYFIEIVANESLGLLGTAIGYPAVVLACTAILVAFMGLPLRLPAFEYLGKISYGLYVYHMMSLYIVDYLMPDLRFRYAFFRFFAAFGMTLAISAASYAVIEKPFLKLKRKFTFIESRAA